MTFILEASKLSKMQLLCNLYSMLRKFSGILSPAGQKQTVIIPPVLNQVSEHKACFISSAVFPMYRYWLVDKIKQYGLTGVSISHSVVSDSLQLWTTAGQTSLSMGFSRQEYWSELPFPSSGDLLNPGIEPMSPALQTDSLLSEPPESVRSNSSSSRLRLHSGIEYV